jgi:hypothetical protein
MTWSVPIPHHDRDQELGEILALGLDQRIEDDEEHRVVAHLLIEATFERGVKSVGDLLDLEPGRKRALLDRARVSAGLKTVAQEELELDRQAQYRASAARAYTDEEGRRLTTCAASGCGAFPTDEVGAWRPVADRKYWCDLHRDQADPDDHLPPEPRYVLDHNFHPVPVGEEAERLRLEEEERQEAVRKAEETKRAEAERLRKLTEHRRAQEVPAFLAAPWSRP